MILSPGKTTIFIDPYSKQNTHYYMVYQKNNFETNKKMTCNVTSNPPTFNYFKKHASFIDFSTCFLRKYRLAIAATAEYTAFFGSQANALAAQVITINRVNGIYETDLGVTLEMIANNIDIVFTTPYPIGVTPYTSGDAGEMVLENQANIDFVIGNANYDIGHVLDRNTVSAGLAGIAVVCNNTSKAQAATGSINPFGDPFDVDFVAHEMGHQFNGNHTQNNNCNRNLLTAVEPGSGSTIMGYAGICPPNVQSRGDAYFNGINLEEMGSFLDGAGDACAVKTAIPAAPIVAPPSNIIVPAGTPFALIASASGAGSASYTYDWEQQDNTPSLQPPVPNNTVGPNFRSFTPTLDNTRYLPNLASLASNGPYTWEVLPAVSRTMKFRISVRANTGGGSCNAYQDMTVSTDAVAGPFKLTYPIDANIQWSSGTPQIITWDVANTDAAPISAATVNIFLSTDGGVTYPISLATGVENNGARQITVPALNTTTARVMVRSANNTFFTISNNNFEITTSASPVITPTLISSARNPLKTNDAFIYYSNVGNTTTADSFVVNGLPDAKASLQTSRNRFVISSINTPLAVENVTITVTRSTGTNARTNSITIPDILQSN